MSTKKKRKTAMWIAISLATLMIMGFIPWLRVTIDSPSKPMYKMNMNLYGNLTVAKSSFDTATMSSYSEKQRQRISFRDRMRLLGLANKWNKPEPYEVAGGLQITVRFGLKSHQFNRVATVNSHLDELVTLLADLSPIPVVDYVGNPLIFPINDDLAT
jgi:hypothetical protein